MFTAAALNFIRTGEGEVQVLMSVKCVRGQASNKMMMYLFTPMFMIVFKVHICP